MLQIKNWIQGLSFRTGVTVLLLCIPFYILSFAQMAIPAEYLSAKAKGIIWIILFGMAKTFQYGGITILGIEGCKKVRQWIKRKFTQ